MKPPKKSPPKRLCIVASYGGSGSTFLAEKIAALPRKPYAQQHVHGVPSENFLGIPVFNPYTDSAEGAFSQTIECPRDAKIILIYRDPSSAYMSRASHQHFLNIWSDTDIADKVFQSNEKDAKRYFKEKKEWEARGEDIFHYAEYMRRWRDYAEAGLHDICFVKYEHLDEAWNGLLEFLEVDPSTVDPLTEFKAKAREIPEHVAPLHADLKAQMATYPNLEVFKGNPETLAARQSRTYPRKLNGTRFACLPVGAGANDALSRIGLVHDVVTAFYDAPFALVDYKNYHAPETDFFKVYNLEDGFERIAKDDLDADAVEMPLSELVYKLMFDDSELDSGKQILIKPDIYPGDKRVRRLMRYMEFDKMAFLKKARYVASEDVFNPSSDAAKVVFHLRRQDICGNELLDDAMRDAIPPHSLKGIHYRKLLTIKRAVEETEGLYPEGTKVDLVITSDGMERVKKQLGRFDGILERAAKLDAELLEEPVSDKLEINLVRRIIGTGTEETRQSLDAMYQADRVLTASSNYPKLICQIGGAEFLRVDLGDD